MVQFLVRGALARLCDVLRIRMARIHNVFLGAYPRTGNSLVPPAPITPLSPLNDLP
jgi:hypothetical protein